MSASKVYGDLSPRMSNGQASRWAAENGIELSQAIAMGDGAMIKRQLAS